MECGTEGCCAVLRVSERFGKVLNVRCDAVQYSAEQYSVVRCIRGVVSAI